MSYDQLMMEFPLVKQHPCNFLNLIGTIQQSHVLLENEKNNYGKVSRNQNAALTKMRTLKTRNEPKQWETRLNGKINKKQQEWKKNEIL